MKLLWRQTGDDVTLKEVGSEVEISAKILASDSTLSPQAITHPPHPEKRGCFLESSTPYFISSLKLKVHSSENTGAWLIFRV